jgi:REP element-mobilizing transposase RayT
MKKYTTRRSWDLGYTGRLWQDRFHDHVLRKNENAPAVVQYILDNPIRKGLTVDWESFPWHGMPDQL